MPDNGHEKERESLDPIIVIKKETVRVITSVSVFITNRSTKVVTENRVVEIDNKTGSVTEYAPASPGKRKERIKKK